MASFVDVLNQGLGAATGTPLGQFGINMMMQAGPQQGNPGGGVRLGQALAGMSEMQKAQALQQYREQMIAQQQAAQNFQVQQARAKAEMQQRQQAAFQDPALQAQLGPMARYLSQAGIDPDTIMKANSNDMLQQHRAAQLQQQASQFAQSQANRGSGSGADHGPKMPTPRMTLDEPLGDGLVQRHKFDEKSGGYVPFGKPFRQFAPTKADPLADLLNEVTPDDNAGAGAAVPGLPGASMPSPAPQGAELLMHSSGSNPMARKPASAPAAPSGDLAAAKSAIAAGKSRQAVIARLTQSGYTPAQIQAAGI